jgi:hypothetical protein
VPDGERRKRKLSHFEKYCASTQFAARAARETATMRAII